MNDGKLPSRLIEAKTLAEGWQKAMIACKDYGYRVETPKQRKDMALGYDGDINIRVANPLEEPIRHRYGIYDDDRGIMQYILEVTHGIHNHWKKDINDPEDTKWGYTYNERFTPQIPFVLERIKKDWEEKQRITGRDYQFVIWRPEEDIILEQDDPPCWQRGHLRFLKNCNGNWVLNYVTDWRSRDLSKAWLENNIAQTRLQKLFADKISDMLGIPIEIGCYTDRSSSLHIYGAYIEEGIENMIENMRNSKLEDMCTSLFDAPEAKLKRIVAAQAAAEDADHGKNLPEDKLIELGYDTKDFEYPKEWDSWPKEWDIKPNKEVFRKCQ